MRIRKRNPGTPHNQQQQQRSLSPPPVLLSYVPQQTPSPEAGMTGPPLSSDHHHHQAAPHVKVSRINARLSSVANGADSKDTIFDAGSPFAQDESTTDHSWLSMSTNESSGHGTFVQSSTSSSVSSSLSNNERWCEEERAMPLKKRRVVMVSCENNQSKKMKEEEVKKKDEVEIRKRKMGETEGYKRCKMKDGKGWRCNKMRLEGSGLCKHHSERQKMKKIKSRNQIKKNKEAKARSISSLLKDTVPLSC